MSTDKISGDSPKKFIPNPSQGDYWGGYMVEGGTVYNLIVAFLGLLGLDKVALRAPLTAVFKFLVNMATFGSWWVYDMIQTYGDQDFVKKYGYSTPLGPDGHGYNMVSTMSSLGAADLKPSGFGLFIYIFYVISSLLLPFGISNMAAGDLKGGGAKLLSCLLYITIPLYMIMGVFEFANSGTIEQKGVSRTWPISWFFLEDKHPASFIIPEGKITSNPSNTQKGGNDPTQVNANNSSQLTTNENTQVNANKTTQLTTNENTQVNANKSTQLTVSDPPPNPQVVAYEKDLQRRVAQGEQPVVQGAISSITKSIGEAITNYPPIKAFKTFSAAAEGVQAASDVVKEGANELKKNPKALLSAFGVNIPPTPTVKLPEVPQDITKLAAAAAAGGSYQRGGALSVYPEMDTLLMGGMAVLVIGGLVAAVFRKISFSTKTDDHEYPLKTYGRDDSPPVPGGV